MTQEKNPIRWCTQIKTRFLWILSFLLDYCWKDFIHSLIAVAAYGNEHALLYCYDYMEVYCRVVCDYYSFLFCCCCCCHGSSPPPSSSSSSWCCYCLRGDDNKQHSPIELNWRIPWNAAAAAAPNRINLRSQSNLDLCWKLKLKKKEGKYVRLLLCWRRWWRRRCVV